MLLQRLESKAGKSPFSPHVALFFGLVRGGHSKLRRQEHCQLSYPSSESSHHRRTTYEDSKGNLSLASPQLHFVLKEEKTSRLLSSISLLCSTPLPSTLSKNLSSPKYLHPSPLKSLVQQVPISLQYSSLAIWRRNKNGRLLYHAINVFLLFQLRKVHNH